jgi:hypothetical protein
MENTTLLLLGSLALALIIGSFISWKARGHIRALAVRLIPLKKRFSDEGFNAQGRYSTVLIFISILIIATIIWFGLFKLSHGLGKPIIELSENHKITNLQTYPDFTEINSPKDKAETESYEAPGAEEELTPEEFSHKEETTIDETKRYYLQLFAFNKESRAWRQKIIWEKKLGEPVWIGTPVSRKGPYKVLVGPFEQRHHSIQFMVEFKLKGFPVKAEDIRLYEP